MMHAQHQQQELHVGWDRLFAVLRESRQLVRRKRAYHKTTYSHHRFRRHPDLLKPGPEQIVATGPEQIWMAYITYLPTRDGGAYLSLVTDAFSRKIVGYNVHESLHTNSVVQAISNGFKAASKRSEISPSFGYRRRVLLGPLPRSTCKTWHHLLNYRRLRLLPDALAERVNGILKTEFLIHRPVDLALATQMVRETIAIYNQERPHLSLKYRTSDSVHRA